MRTFLLILGWSSVVGSIGDAALGGYAFWLIAASGDVDASISLDAFLRDHVAIIYWVKQVAYFVLPAPFVNWLFGLPASIYFPVRIIVSVAIGYWALQKAAQLSRAENPMGD